MDEDKPLHMNEGGVIQAEVQAGPTISCIICAYNEGRRIRSVLDAVAGYPGFSEVIVVDDGSVDGTAAAVRAYPNVNLISDDLALDVPSANAAFNGVPVTLARLDA